jgi:hypothetical protein
MNRELHRFRSSGAWAFLEEIGRAMLISVIILHRNSPVCFDQSKTMNPLQNYPHFFRDHHFIACVEGEREDGWLMRKDDNQTQKLSGILLDERRGRVSPIPIGQHRSDILKC